MVSTHLKHISPIGNLPQIGVKIKNIWNHHLDDHKTSSSPLLVFRIEETSSVSDLNQDGSIPKLRQFYTTGEFLGGSSHELQLASNYASFSSPIPGLVGPLLNGIFWLINRGDPNYLRYLGWSSKQSIQHAEGRPNLFFQAPTSGRYKYPDSHGFLLRRKVRLVFYKVVRWLPLFILPWWIFWKYFWWYLKYLNKHDDKSLKLTQKNKKCKGHRHVFPKIDVVKSHQITNRSNKKHTQFLTLVFPMVHTTFFNAQVPKECAWIRRCLSDELPKNFHQSHHVGSIKSPSEKDMVIQPFMGILNF